MHDRSPRGLISLREKRVKRLMDYSPLRAFQASLMHTLHISLTVRRQPKRGSPRSFLFNLF
jgi:hypothetical protein